MDAVFRNVEQIVRMEVIADLRAVFFLEQLAALAVQNQNDLVAIIVRVGWNASVPVPYGAQRSRRAACSARCPPWQRKHICRPRAHLKFLIFCVKYLHRLAPFSVFPFSGFLLPAPEPAFKIRVLAGPAHLRQRRQTGEIFFGECKVENVQIFQHPQPGTRIFGSGSTPLCSAKRCTAAPDFCRSARPSPATAADAAACRARSDSIPPARCRFCGRTPSHRAAYSRDGTQFH